MTQIEREIKILEAKMIIEGEQRRATAMLDLINKGYKEEPAQGVEFMLEQFEKCIEILDSIK